MHAYQPERLNQTSRTSNPVVAFVADNALLCAGAGLSLAMMAVILTNAIWYQPEKHPSPLFSTRVNTPLIETASVKKPVKTVSVKTNASVQTPATLELLREVQTALSVRGYYSGKLDGVYGSRTRKAINTFQKDQGLQADGKASVRLLTRILMSASARPTEVPVPKQKDLASVVKKVKTVAIKTKTAEKPANGLIAQIQSGLRAYGYDELVVDGKMGQQTATAIQRFQLDYGMKITGEPSSKVLSKLRDIGAYKQG